MSKKALLLGLLFSLLLLSTPFAKLQGQNCQPSLPLVFLNTAYQLPAGKVIKVNAGDNLQSALNAAVAGDILELQAGATFAGNFTLRKKSGSGWIYIRSSKENVLPPPGTRISPTDAPNMAKILSVGMVAAFSTEAGAANYRLIGLEIGMSDSPADQFNLVNFGAGTETKLSDLPDNLILDRCYVHGNNAGNLKVGVALNCARAAILDCHIDNIHAQSGVSTFESKAIASFNGSGPFKIVNNFLEASHINILFGGAKSAIANLVPSDVEIRCNTFTKRKSWNPGDPAFQGKTWGVKNLFEIKSGQRMLLEGNVFEQCWPSDPNVAGGAQAGFGILLTTRDENGTMPWCVVQDITFQHNIIRSSNCGVSLYGSEGKGLHRVRFHNNLFTDIGGSWGNNDKTGRLFQATALDDLCLDHNTLLHSANNIIFAYGTVSGISMTNNLTQWYDGFQGLTFTGWDKNVFIGGKPAGFPAGNFFPASIADVKFADFNLGNYALSSNSPYWKKGTDGLDIGANFSTLNSTLADCTKTSTSTDETADLASELLLFPNPNVGSFVLRAEWDLISTVKIFNQLGSEVTAQVYVNQEGSTSLATVELLDPLPGIYTVQLFGPKLAARFTRFVVCK